LKDLADVIGKAENWLLNVANDIEGVWDQEALVYLRSRGHDCHDQIAALSQTWKEAEQERFDDYNERAGKMRGIKANAGNVASHSPILLRDFWCGAPPEDYSSEAIMLRTAEWCEIAGFDSWWHRLAYRLKENAFSREDANLRPPWLFNMVRSDYAIKLIPHVLDRYLEDVSISGPDKPAPWIVPQTETSDCLEQSLLHASAIVFAHHRLNSVNSDPELVQEAVDTICKLQDSNGAWRIFTSDQVVSIESTAMAVHALALAQPRSWSRIATHARKWLCSVQQEDGSWHEPGTPGPAYLTVLALDSIAVSNGEKTVTFRCSMVPRETSSQQEVSRQASDLLSSPRGDRRTKMVGPPTTKLPVDKWEEITISFLSEERVQIWGGNQTEICNYSELGFEDGRMGKPRRAWTMLQVLAASGGSITDTRETRGTWPMVEKRMQEIRKMLRQYFKIAPDPVPFVHGREYRARFKVVVRPSYES